MFRHINLSVKCGRLDANLAVVVGVTSQVQRVDHFTQRFSKSAVSPLSQQLIPRLSSIDRDLVDYLRQNEILDSVDVADVLCTFVCVTPQVQRAHLYLPATCFSLVASAFSVVKGADRDFDCEAHG